MRQINRIIFCIVIALLTMATHVWAAVSVQLNGQQMTFDVPPRIEGGRTLVPLRAIFEGLGAEVSWNGETRTVTANRNGTVIVLPVESKIAQINGQPITLDVPAKIVGGRTLVPLRFVSEALGAQVDWDGATETVSIAMQSGIRGTFSIEEITNKALPATVLIKTDSGSGSGFLLDNKGTVATNYHVISNASSASVTTHDGREYSVNGILAEDKEKDLAILGTAATGYPFLVLDPNTVPRAGQSVIAIGSPLGLQGSVSSGIVSNPVRKIGITSFIQHTAPISPGNSGGPLLNSTGKVIGMNTASLAVPNAQNINFAVEARSISSLWAARSVSADPLPGGKQMSVAEYEAWISETFYPKSKECMDEITQTNDAIDKGLLRVARDHALDAAFCYDQFAKLSFSVDLPHEVRLNHYNLTMFAAFNVAQNYLTVYAIDSYLNGDMNKYSGLWESSIALMKIANEYQFRAGNSSSTENTPTPIKISADQYMNWLSGTFDPKWTQCVNRGNQSAQANNEGLWEVARDQAGQATSCFSELARQSYFLELPYKLREQQYNLLMATAFSAGANSLYYLSNGVAVTGNFALGASFIDGGNMVLKLVDIYLKNAMTPPM